MAKKLDARVQQKAATLEEWNAIDLPTLDGEQLFVRSDVDDRIIGFKFGAKGKKFRDLPYPDLTARGKVSPDSSWSGRQSGVYIPTKDGQYNGINISLIDGYQVLYWDGSSLEKVIYPVKIDFDIIVEDSLTSSSTTKALSANQGKNLNENIYSIYQGGVEEGSLTLDKFSQATIDYIGSSGNVTNNPDDEDIKSAVDNGVNVLKFNDRLYDPIQFSGLGNKIIRKRIVGGKNILLVSELTPNSVVEIRYDFDLNGQTINIPDNITLKFNGGSIKNGTLIGNNTKIIANLVKIFGLDTIFEGTYSIESVSCEWFGGVGYAFATNPDYMDWSPLDPVNQGVDSAEAIIKAIELAFVAKCEVHLTSGRYKSTKKIYVPDNVSVYVPTSGSVKFWRFGDGKKIIKVDRDGVKSTPRTETVKNEATLTLRENEYIHTDSLAICFELSPNGARIYGGGKILLTESKYAIGIYIRGFGYSYTDMIWNVSLDVKMVCGKPSNTYPDDADLFVNSVPDDDTGVVGDFAYVTTSKAIYRKNGQNKWIWYANSDCFYNTAIRKEADSTSTDTRIINTSFKLNAIYGFRGVEIIAYNKSWVNDSIWEGTVSNMSSNFVTVLGEAAFHDFRNLTFQTDPLMAKSSRIFFAGAGNATGIKCGRTWDLAWNPGIRVTTAYELGKNTRSIELKADGLRFIINTSMKNSISGYDPYEVNSTYVNILKFNAPNNVEGLVQPNQYNEITYGDLPTSSILFTDSTKFNSPNFKSRLTKLFDENPNNYEILVDTANSKICSTISLINWGSENVRVTTKTKNRFLVLEYTINKPDNLNSFQQSAETFNDMYMLLLGNSGFEKEYKLSNYYPYDYWGCLGMLHVDISKLPIQTLSLAFYTKTPNSPNRQTLEVRNIKLLTSHTLISNRLLTGGTTAQMPNSAPKGQFYEDTTLNTTLVNKGDSTAQNWVELPTEQVGVWTIITGADITASTGNYSKIGKQVNLAGQLTFAGSYTTGTNISIIMPFAPQFGGVYVVGDLTFTMTNNSTTLQVKSSTTGANKPFQLNFKTI